MQKKPPQWGAGVNEELAVSVKDQIVRILANGATLVTSLEGFLHGDERRAVRGVIESYPELFEVFGDFFQFALDVSSRVVHLCKFGQGHELFVQGPPPIYPEAGGAVACLPQARKSASAFSAGARSVCRLRGRPTWTRTRNNPVMSRGL